MKFRMVWLGFPKKFILGYSLSPQGYFNLNSGKFVATSGRSLSLWVGFALITIETGSPIPAGL